MPKGIFVTIKDIMIVCGVCQAQAGNKKRTYLDILDKKKNITVKEFCKLEEITGDDFYEALINELSTQNNI